MIDVVDAQGHTAWDIRCLHSERIVRVNLHAHAYERFFIGMGWPGFYLPFNVGGYDSAKKALAASKRCETRRENERRAS